MNTREQFGNYLLLKKLTEDALGETFRAGVLGPGGMDKVALLRVFNGQGLDGGRLWSAVEDRQPISQNLRSPNIGDGIELNQIQSIPYVAWDYVSGKNMATLLEQAAKKRNFIPTEHALLITERVALALAAAYETRHGADRILHGFLIPQLTIISNEGEARLLGFEVGPGLRNFVSSPIIRQHFGRYLSPETLAGQPLNKADDIYSLGVFLFELLTGRPLPPPSANGYAPVIDQGVLATEQTPIPEPIRDLLKKSLVPQAERMDDVVAWHKTLNGWMFDQYNPTTFNLAFYMHNLFRQEIERESQEIEVEKTLPVPTVQAPAAPPPPAAASSTSIPLPPPPNEASRSGVMPPQAQEGTKSGVVVTESTENFVPEYAREERSKMPIVAGAVVALAIIAGAAFWMFSGGGGAAEPPPPPPPVVAAPPPPTELPEPTGPTEEEIQAKIQELIGQESSAIEDQLRSQYDEQLKELQDQLAKAQKDAEERRKEQERLAEEARLAEERQAELEKEAEAAKAAEEEAKLAEKEAEEEPEEIAEAAPPETAPPTQAPPPPVVAPPPPKPAEPQVRRGDLVEMGPGVVRARPLRIAPRYPEMARRIGRKTAVVTVRVLVDENGKALEVEQVSEKVGMGFDKEAISAAKRGTYQAATKNGVPVKMWARVDIKFTP